MIDGNNVAFFGCKNTTKDAIKRFQNKVGNVDHLITISSELARKHKVAGYEDLKKFARENGIDIYTCEKYSLSDRDIENILFFDIDIAFSIGWQRIIKGEVLNNIPFGIYGMHGSCKDLPKGRGRSPMNWALILDKNKFYTNLFKYEEGIDNGKIVGKQIFGINKYDTIETLHFKNRIAMNKLIEEHIYDILNDNISLKEQNDEKATYYPKRKPKDGFIDWNLKTKDIYNLMRALTKPYPGFFTKLGSKKLYFWDLRPFTEKIKFNQYDPGTIIEKLHNGKFIVKTVDSSIIVHEYEFEGADSEIEEGIIFESKSTSEIYDGIESRYYDFVDETQKEIRKEKILNFYNLR